jgi:carbonic anhydrase/acetyltransferase-like protein (isoleucine patch superfamily)
MAMLHALWDLDTNRPLTALKYLYYRLRGKKIVAHSRAIIKGVDRISTIGHLHVGTQYVGFSHPKEITYLNVRGILTVKGRFLVGRGCRVDIGPGAVCEFGSGYINVNSKIVISHGLKVGKDVSIAWDCEFLDDDFHQLCWDGKEERDPGIEIGNHVWIGSGVTILKGVKIGDNNVIGAGTVVTKPFTEQNVLIAGNPARIVKRGIAWK